MSRLLVALLAAAKRVASTHPRLEALARWFHGHLSGRYRKDPTRLIAKAIQSDDAVIVQIGSNDGFLGDPIYPLLARNPGWTCLFVEPVPHVFAKLRALHGQDSRHKFENSAINDGSRMTFHYLDPSVSDACGGVCGATWIVQSDSYHPSAHYEMRDVGADMFCRRLRDSR